VERARTTVSNFPSVNFSTRGRVEIDGQARLYHKTELPASVATHYALYHVNAPIAGFDTDRESFFRPLQTASVSPTSVGSGRNRKTTRSLAGGPRSPSHCLGDRASARRNEKPSSSRSAMSEVPKDEKWGEAPASSTSSRPKQLIEAFSTTAQVQRRRLSKAARAFGTGLLGSYVLSSKRRKKLNRMLNIWNPYQCMVTFNMFRGQRPRTSSRGIGRGMGFRELEPRFAGLRALGAGDAPPRNGSIRQSRPTQFADGSAYHPVSAAHQARQQRTSVAASHDDPAVANSWASAGLHQRDRRLGHPRRTGGRSTNDEKKQGVAARSTASVLSTMC